MSICEICGESVRTKTSGTRCDGSCGKSYHYKCHSSAENTTTIPRTEGKKWTCARCSDQSPSAPRVNFKLGHKGPPRSADLSPPTRSTVVPTVSASAAAASPFSISVDVGNSLSKLQQDVQQLLTSVSAMQVALGQVQRQQAEINKTQNELLKSIEFVTEKVHEFEERLMKQDKKIADQAASISKLEPLTAEVQRLRKDVSRLETQRDDAEQRQLVDYVELKGVPAAATDLAAAVLAVAAAASCPLQPTDLALVRRARPPLKSPAEANLHIKFVTTAARDQFLNGVRGARQLTSRGAGLPGDDKRLYANELLTNHRKRLLFEAKARARAQGFQFVWVKKGQVLVRKNAKETKHWVIRNEGDLDYCFRN